MKYLDFDLIIERSADGYVARVFNSPAGQATAAFREPFSDLEIENFLLRIGRSRHAVRRIESPEAEPEQVLLPCPLVVLESVAPPSPARG